MKSSSNLSERPRRPLTTVAIVVAILSLGILAITIGAAGSALGATAGNSQAHAVGQAQTEQEQAVQDAGGVLAPAQPQDCGLLWRVVPSLDGGTNINLLQGVTAITAGDVWAIGSYSEIVGGAQRFRAMAEHWDGVSWSTVSVPQPGDESVLYSASALSTSDIWAVGYYWPSPSTTIQTFTLHWNGSVWSQVPSPNFSAAGNALYGVSAPGPDAVWAVGIQGGQSLAMFWDGTTWASIPTPNPDTYDYLQSVTAITPDDMWAVGYTEGSSPAPRRTFTIHCTRAACDTVASPNSGVDDTELKGVSALSSGEVFAVGYSTVTTDTHATVPLALRWNGVGWSALPTPPLPLNMLQVRFTAVTATASNDVWAVGSAYNPPTGQGQTYAAHWDGTEWTTFSPPNRGITNYFVGTGTAGPNDVWAVGDYSNGGNITQTLIEHYSDPCITPSPTVTLPPDATLTPSPQPTSAACPIQFNDVPQSSAFYTYVRCLACRNILSGYACGGAGEPCPGSYFRPGNNVTRGQAAKIISNAAAYADDIPPSQQTLQRCAYHVSILGVHREGASAWCYLRLPVRWGR